MPLFMPTFCLLNTRATVTSQCMPRAHSTTTARGWQGTKEGSLCSFPGLHSLHKELSRDNLIVVLTTVALEIHPVLNVTIMCSNSLLPVSNFGSSSTCKPHSWDGLEHVRCSICVGGQKLLHLTNTAACYCGHSVNYTRSSKDIFYSAL